MKTMTITLTDAFKVRQLLKKSIMRNSRVLQNVQLHYNEETDGKLHRNFQKKYGSLEKLLKLVLAEEDALGELNTAFDKANVEIRPLLNRVESLRCKIDTLKELDSAIECSSDTREQKFETQVVLTKLTPVFDDSLVDEISMMLKRAKSEKLELEEKISAMNGAAKITVNLAEDVYEDIYGI